MKKTLLFLILLLLVSVQAHAQAASAVLNWVDNSGSNPAVNDSEEGFTVYRSFNGAPYVAIGAVARNITTYTDATLVTPAAVFAPLPALANTYCYNVTAFNHGVPVPPAAVGPLQEAAATNTACKTILGAVIPLTVPAAASGLTAK